MSNRDLSLALRLYTDSAKFVSGLTQAGSGVQRFASGAKHELASLRTAAGSVQGQLAQLGLSVSAVALAVQSARMDKSLTQIGQTAGMSADEVAKLRKELFRMAGETGQPVDDLKSGFNNAVQAGLKFGEALPVIDAVNTAVAVTGASADKLTGSLTVAATAFDFKLDKAGQASLLLDKMTAAGRLGNAELENLSDIFARVGVNAASANLNFDKTLGFIEGLSLIERQPERLATLADSTLRIFTNAKYMQAANKATGVKFFDKDGARRDAVEVLGDIKKKYDKLKTDKDRSRFISTAFGQADLDTIKGLRTLLGGDMLGKVGEFSRQIALASGTLDHDLPAAISNAVDQTGRLKTKLREAADGFAKPINDTFQNVIKWGLDKKDKGGLELSGGEIAGGGLAAMLGLFLGGRYGGKLVGGLAKKFGGTAAGVAEGKVLEAAAGVTPVFVVNMPGGGLASAAGSASEAAATAAKAAAAAPAATAATEGLISSTVGPLALAAIPLMVLGGAAWMARNPLPGESTWLQDQVPRMKGISDSVTRALGFQKSWDDRRRQNRMGLGGDDAVDGALTRNDQTQKLQGEISIKVSKEGEVTSVRAISSNSAVPFTVGYAGATMRLP